MPKGDMLSLVESATVALGGDGMRCNGILPGTVGSRLNEENLNGEEKRGYMEGGFVWGKLARRGISRAPLAPIQVHRCA